MGPEKVEKETFLVTMIFDLRLQFVHDAHHNYNLILNYDFKSM